MNSSIRHSSLPKSDCWRGWHLGVKITVSISAKLAGRLRGNFRPGSIFSIHMFIYSFLIFMFPFIYGDAFLWVFFFFFWLLIILAFKIFNCPKYGFVHLKCLEFTVRSLEKTSTNMKFLERLVDTFLKKVSVR